MKIMLGCSSSPEKAGGISTYTKDLALTLRDLGHEIFYVSPSENGVSWFEREQIDHFKVTQFVDQVQQCKNVYHHAIEKGIELIINNDSSVLQSIAPLVPCAFISICHLESKAVAAMAGLNSRWCDYVVAISYDMQEKLLKKFPLEPLKVPVVFNGIRGVEAPIRNIEEGAPLRCLFSGNYNRRKGADLFRNFLLSRSVPENTEYYWCGGLPPAVEREMSALPHVRHTGRVSRVEFLEMLSQADVLMFPSREEGCPMSVLEAMALGVVPIVSNGHGAMRHIVSHGLDGYVCSLKNWVNESASVLSWLEKDRTLLPPLREKARQTQAQRFQMHMTAENLIALARRPTVERSGQPRAARIYQWHRPGIEVKGGKASHIERARFRYGWLKSVGVLSVE